MAVSHVTFTPFNDSKKSSWLGADINGLIYTWGASVAFGAVLWAIIAALTGVNVGAPLGWAIDMAENQWGHDAGLWTTFGLTLLPSFLLVFVFRFNFTVVGTRRQFRYFCRWL
jgi:ABC-type microcin C transport system permease subunit YejE